MPSSSNTPLQVFQQSKDRNVVSYGPNTSSPPSEVHASSCTSASDDLPIALRKGSRTRTQHPIANFVSYDRLSPHLHSFACTLPWSIFLHLIIQLCPCLDGNMLMHEEMRIRLGSLLLYLVGTQLLVVTRCIQLNIFVMVSMSIFKAAWWLRATLKPMVLIILETFSPVTRLNSLQILRSFAIIRFWPLYQLDIKNAFLHGDLKEEVNIEQPPGYVVSVCDHLVCRFARLCMV